MGLQQRVREQLAHVSPKEKDTLEKLISHSLEIGQNNEELDAEKKAYKAAWTPRSTGTSSGSSAAKTVSQGGDAMDVDAQKTRGGPDSDLKANREAEHSSATGAVKKGILPETAQKRPQLRLKQTRLTKRLQRKKKSPWSPLRR